MKKIKNTKVTTALLLAVVTLITIGITMAEFVWNKKKVGSDQVRGMRNNNPLNLRRTSIEWKHEKEVVTDKEFEEFETLMWGLRAGVRNMRTKIQQGYNTLEELIFAWAPPGENNSSNYVDIISRESGYDVDQILEFENDFMYPVVKAMCKIESNLNLSKDLYNEAWKNI